MNINEQCRGECLTPGDEDYGFGTFPEFEHTRDRECDCVPIKCLNYKFCENAEPEWYILDCHDGLCGICHADHSNITRLTFKDNENNEQCPVCLEEPLFLIKFPPCVHYFCKSCTSNICLWDETRYHLSPVPYGSPPCPNGCENPIKGRQCYCEEYFTIENNWKQSNPEDYQRWYDDDNLSILQPDLFYANKTCPLCRAKF